MDRAVCLPERSNFERSNFTSQRGVTLIEMLVVVVIVAIIAGIAFPSATSGLDSIRLASASNTVASCLSAAVNRAERRQEPIELTISKTDSRVILRGFRFEKIYEMPMGVRITAVMPEVPPTADLTQARHFLLYPGGAPPRIGVRLTNSRGGQRMISLNPVTGVPIVERLDRAE